MNNPKLHHSNNIIAVFNIFFISITTDAWKPEYMQQHYKVFLFPLQLIYESQSTCSSATKCIEGHKNFIQDEEMPVSLLLATKWYQLICNPWWVTSAPLNMKRCLSHYMSVPNSSHQSAWFQRVSAFQSQHTWMKLQPHLGLSVDNRMKLFHIFYRMCALQCESQTCKL